MVRAKTLVSVTAAALSLGFSLQPHPAPFWDTNIVIAADETSSKKNLEDSSAAESAMGKDEGTQAANQGTPAEDNTQKIDQPPRQNPTTGDQQ